MAKDAGCERKEEVDHLLDRERPEDIPVAGKVAAGGFKEIDMEGETPRSRSMPSMRLQPGAGPAGSGLIMVGASRGCGLKQAGMKASYIEKRTMATTRTPSSSERLSVMA